jgi:hypothetical protein
MSEGASGKADEDQTLGVHFWRFVLIFSWCLFYSECSLKREEEEEEEEREGKVVCKRY